MTLPVHSALVAGALLAAVVLSGCGQKEPPREITRLERAEAANLASEADFALQIRQRERAEELLTKAVQLAPDELAYWAALGRVRKLMGNTSGARQAYEQTVKLYGEVYAKNAASAEPLVHQAYVQALLGRWDDAGRTLERARQAHPDDRQLKALMDGDWRQRLRDDPGFKESAL